MPRRERTSPQRRFSDRITLMGCLLKQGGGLYPRLRIGAVLLAAGEGRRMGGVVKPLIRLQGVPLIRRQLVALSGAGVDEVVVVTGHAHAAVEEQVRSFTVTLAHNAEHAQGQEGSVRAGLAALNGPFDAVFVMPADQPLIAAGDLTELIGAFKKRPRGHVVVPVVEGARGNPILIDEFAHGQILASGPHLACRHLLERQPEFVHAHDTANTRFITDLDTLDDVRSLAQRTGWKLELPELEAVG
jgi:CTP:molybdopterin cytidylyltransferase MocA